MSKYILLTATSFMYDNRYCRGRDKLQDFTTLGLATFASTSKLDLVHNTNVYVTVVAENGAGLRTVSHSQPILIDLTPPVFSFFHDAEYDGMYFPLISSLYL